MINKIKNWIKNHRYITAAGLFVASICAIAFGFAHFGPQNEPDEWVPVVDLNLGTDEGIMEDDEY